MLECALLLVSFAMVMGRLVFRNLLCGGRIVEKYSKMELNDGFVKNVNFVKYGVIFVLFTENGW